jgi:hypothetical protein
MELRLPALTVRTGDPELFPQPRAHRTEPSFAGTVETDPKRKRSVHRSSQNNVGQVPRLRRVTGVRAIIKSITLVRQDNQPPSASPV